MKKILSNLTECIKGEIISGVDKGILAKINKSENDIKNVFATCKGLDKKIAANQGEIVIIKDMLSKKANFSDILKHVEGKADKGDYKELKNLIEASN
jgi:hypothetical protein